MIVDGVALAGEFNNILENEVSHVKAQPHLTVITCSPGFATQKYIALKKKIADKVGIGINIIELPKDSTTEDVCNTIARMAIQTDGIIVQLPLPAQLDRKQIIAAIPAAVDVDGMHFAEIGKGFLPPVVAAIDMIAKRQGIEWSNKNVVVVGGGLLVGRPAVVWAEQQGAQVTMITETTRDPRSAISTADIVISGVGKPGLIKPDDLKTGVVLFDAGTAEEDGELRGDIDPDCADKASLYTPVPGGIGPLTVTMLLRNVLASCEQSAMMSGV